MLTSKNLLILFALLLTHQMGFSQFFGEGKPEDIKEVPNHPLVVVLELPLDEKIKELSESPKSKDILIKYKQDVENYNIGFKAAIKRFWKMHKQSDIVYVFSNQTGTLEQRYPEGYSMLSCNTMTPPWNGNSRLIEPQDYLKWNSKINEKRDYIYDYSNMVLLYSKPGKKRYIQVGHANLPNVFPLKMDLAFGVIYLQKFFEYRLKDKKVKDFKDEMKDEQIKLANRTLILWDEWVPGKMSDDQIKTMYPFNFRVVNQEEFEEILFGEDEKYAFVIIQPEVASFSNANQLLFSQYVIDAKTSNFLGSHEYGYVGLAGPGSSMISKNSLKSFTKFLK
jgi:hypothetical protein